MVYTPKYNFDNPFAKNYVSLDPIKKTEIYGPLAATCLSVIGLSTAIFSKEGPLFYAGLAAGFGPTIPYGKKVFTQWMPELFHMTIAGIRWATGLQSTKNGEGDWQGKYSNLSNLPNPNLAKGIADFCKENDIPSYVDVELAGNGSYSKAVSEAFDGRLGAETTSYDLSEGAAKQYGSQYITINELSKVKKTFGFVSNIENLAKVKDPQQLANGLVNITAKRGFIAEKGFILVSSAHPGQLGPNKTTKPVQKYFTGFIVDVGLSNQFKRVSTGSLYGLWHGQNIVVLRRCQVN